MDDPARKPRFRFSLTTLVLLTTIVAMAITIAVQWRELRPLREEIRGYRNQLGILRIDEPSKVHAIRLPTEDDEPRRYRVYLPPGRTYWFHYKVRGVPKVGILPSMSNKELQPGEYVFSINFKRDRDPATGEPRPFGAFRFQMAESGDVNVGWTNVVGVSQREVDWIVNAETGGTMLGWQDIGREVELSRPDEPLVLYRARGRTVIVKSRNPDGSLRRWQSQSIDGPTDGCLVWISDQQEVEADRGGGRVP